MDLEAQACAAVLTRKVSGQKLSESFGVLRSRAPQSLVALVQLGRRLFSMDSRMDASLRAVTTLVLGDTEVSRPAYHNLEHIVDATAGYLRLATAESATHFPPGAAAHHKALGLIAIVGHDYLHPGGCNAPGNISQFETLSFSGLALQGAFSKLSGEAAEVIKSCIAQTDHAPFAQSSRQGYLDCLRSGRWDSQSCLVALVRQADLFRSVGLTAEDGLDCGQRLKREFLAASNCPYLAGQAFVSCLDTPQAQATFSQSNPCYVESWEGTRIRSQMAKNLEIYQPLELEV